MAGTTGLEPATSAVTGQRSNQLSYVPSAISIAERKSQNLLPSPDCPLPMDSMLPLRYLSTGKRKVDREVVTTSLFKLYQTN
jgi:hypothetical protein